MIPARLFLLAALLAGPAAAQQSASWVFVEHDGSGDKTGYNAAHYYPEYQKDPGDAEELYGWIASQQRASGEDANCYGNTLKAETVDRAAKLLESSLNGYYDIGFRPRDFEQRAAGVRVENTWLGPKEVVGRANYFTCKPAGFFSTSNIGEKSANLIKMGPATNALNNHEPAFRLAAAHELGHVFQNNTAPYARSSSYDRIDKDGHWLIEGSIDALAVFNTQKHYGKDYFGPYSNKYYRRFFLSRPYNIPLNLAPGVHDRLLDSFRPDQRKVLEDIDEDTLAKLAYQTNGFWYHVIERYLNGNPARLRELYRRMGAKDVLFSLTRIVDEFLDEVDGDSMAGLQHVYPQFLAEYAAWWKHRFAGRMEEEKWLGLGFNGCEDASLSTISTSVTISLSLADYAGDCFTIRVPPQLLHGKPDMEIRLTGDAPVVNEVYLGYAGASGFAEASRNRACQEIVEKKLSPKAAPCLLDPRQGSSRGMLQRYFNVPDLSGAGGELSMTFVASRVPNVIRDKGDDYDLDPVGVTVSLDVATLEPAGTPGSGTDARSDDEAGTEQAAVVDYASKSGRSRVSPEGEKSPGEATPRDIFSGNIDTMPIADDDLRQLMMQMRDANLTVRLEPDTGQAGNEMRTVGFRFMNDPPQPGFTGAIEVQATSSEDRIIGLQNPDQPSRLVIEEYSDETLRFRGVAHVCEGDPMTLGARGGETLCRIFKPQSYRVSGAVSFPTVRNSVARLRNEETDTYLAYRDLRLDALLGPDDVGGLLGADGKSMPGASNGGQSGSGAAGAAQSADDGCDCSCSGRVDDPSARCKLVCGKQWQSCSATD